MKNPDKDFMTIGVVGRRNLNGVISTRREIVTMRKDCTPDQVMMEIYRVLEGFTDDLAWTIIRRNEIDDFMDQIDKFVV
jgi:hypothetical protein